VNALILAGGENKRLHVLKGFLEIKGRRIIESNIELLKKIFDCVIISTNNPEYYFYLGVPMLGDIVKYRGPMTGILSALITIEAPGIFVTGCDMPFIKPELIRYIVGRWTDSQEAVIPIFDSKPQPLLGVYSKKLVPKMEDSIQKGMRGLREFLKKREVLYIGEDEVRTLDPEGRSFVNINTMEDYERAISS
jgi:molybdopterin-guanine dinucleotide biosynthesis protein A